MRGPERMKDDKQALDAEQFMNSHLEKVGPESRRYRAGERSSAGFTLIELMITIAILAIIVGVAIPSYNQYVLESGRADGKSTLLQASQTLERCFTRYSAYNDANCPLADGSTITSENDKYQVTVDSTATTFDLTAAPQGGQTKDTDCGNLTLDHTGRKGAKGGFEDDVVEECW